MNQEAETEKRVDLRRRVAEIRDQHSSGLLARMTRYAMKVGGEPMPSEIAIDDLLAALDAADRDVVEADDRARGFAFEIMQIHDALAQAGNALGRSLSSLSSTPEEALRDLALSSEALAAVRALAGATTCPTPLQQTTGSLHCELVLRRYGDAMRAADEVAERVGDDGSPERYAADLAFEVAFDEVVDLSKKLSVAAAAGTPVLVLEEEP